MREAAVFTYSALTAVTADQAQRNEIPTRKAGPSSTPLFRYSSVLFVPKKDDALVQSADASRLNLVAIGEIVRGLYNLFAVTHHLVITWYFAANRGLWVGGCRPALQSDS